MGLGSLFMLNVLRGAGEKYSERKREERARAAQERSFDKEQTRMMTDWERKQDRLVEIADKQEAKKLSDATNKAVNSVAGRFKISKEQASTLISEIGGIDYVPELMNNLDVVSQYGLNDYIKNDDGSFNAARIQQFGQTKDLETERNSMLSILNTLPEDSNKRIELLGKVNNITETLNLLESGGLDKKVFDTYYKSFKTKVIDAATTSKFDYSGAYDLSKDSLGNTKINIKDATEFTKFLNERVIPQYKFYMGSFQGSENYIQSVVNYYLGSTTGYKMVTQEDIDNSLTLQNQGIVAGQIIRSPTKEEQEQMAIAAREQSFNM